jgi:hypothetical protein
MHCGHSALDGPKKGGLGAADDDPDVAERFSSWLSHEGRSRRFWLASARGRPVGMVNLLVVRRMPRPGQHDRA